MNELIDRAESSIYAQCRRRLDFSVWIRLRDVIRNEIRRLVDEPVRNSVYATVAGSSFPPTIAGKLQDATNESTR